MEEKLDKEVLIARIQKLLALAENNTHGPEMEAARNKAVELMAKYSIQMAEVILQKKDASSSIVEETVDEVTNESHEYNWEGSLASGIARCFDAEVISNIYSSYWGGDREIKLSFIGLKSDIDIAIYFFQYLRRSIGQKAERLYTRKHDIVSYGLGASATVIERMKDLYQARNEISAECRDLVIIKKDGVEGYMRSKYPDAKIQKRTSKLDFHAYMSGSEDAKKISLVRPLKEPENRARIGE